MVSKGSFLSKGSTRGELREPGNWGAFPLGIRGTFGNHSNLVDRALRINDDRTYTFLSSFLGEMRGLFPQTSSAHWHMGGDGERSNGWLGLTVAATLTVDRSCDRDVRAVPGPAAWAQNVDGCAKHQRLRRAAAVLYATAALAGALAAPPRSGGGRLGGRRLERRGGQLARRGGHRPGLRGRWL